MRCRARAGQPRPAAGATRASAPSSISRPSAPIPNSEVAYGRTKARGRAGGAGRLPRATILRPSVLFGPDDKFLNLFAGLIGALPVVPVFGPDKPFQPLFVDDAARRRPRRWLSRRCHGGKTYEIGGPEVVTMLELHQRIAAAQGRSGRCSAAARRGVIGLCQPDRVAAPRAAQP